MRERIEDEIDTVLSDEAQLTGPLFLDEISTGRSMEAANLDIASIPLQRPEVVIEGHLSEVGSLCIRHPRPAVLVTREVPKYGIVQVASTQAALGFDYPMFLLIGGHIKADANTHVLTGVFHIPIADHDQGSFWSKIIQNSSRFLYRARIEGNEVVSDVIITVVKSEISPN